MDDTYVVGNWVTTPWNHGHWIDGCDHDVILFDDVETIFKRLTDRYPIFQVYSSPGRQELSSLRTTPTPPPGGLTLATMTSV